uniref:Uncharacterized protein n=1 Tax=Meloidogyne enterolobii TaxID=390850 RepID=A0A6V7XVI2_MELEN|nr:unnamed protein product [Meloidogyne enterolobii]
MLLEPMVWYNNSEYVDPGAGQCTADTTCFKTVESGTPCCLMHLENLNRTIPGRPGFENFERSSRCIGVYKTE